jgi:hypothetical protein
MKAITQTAENQSYQINHEKKGGGKPQSVKRNQMMTDD